MIKILRLLLFPISVLYGAVMAVRNVLFTKGILKSESYDLPVLAIGNITVGGTGKTPHTEYIIRLLKEDHKLAILSRGYGRSTKGFVEVKEDSTPEQCGDEPCQMKQKFPEQLVVVNENRREGISEILDRGDSDVVLLDDAYQHRWVKPGFSIVLVDYNRPIFSDFIMPTGRLREFPSGTKRADIVIVSKCPAGTTEQDKAHFIHKLRIKETQSIFFSSFSYGEAKAVFSSKSSLELGNAEVLLLTGIANPRPLQDYLERKGASVHSQAFPDHYQFTDKDMNKVLGHYEKLDAVSRCIITTEKDAVRLKSGMSIPETIKDSLFYLPIEVEILDNKEEFNQIVKDYVEKN